MQKPNPFSAYPLDKPASAPPAAQQIVLWEHLTPWIARVEQLEKELSTMKAQQSVWVDTSEAKRITGIKSCAALKRLRERPNSPIVVRTGEENSKRPKYLRASLITYCESKTKKPTQPGRNLAA
jgi:hypothetical protein